MKKIILFIIIWLFVWVFVYAATMISINSDYYRISWGSANSVVVTWKNIDLCKVLHYWWSQNFFLPKKSTAERNAFIANPPSGVTFTNWSWLCGWVPTCQIWNPERIQSDIDQRNDCTYTWECKWLCENAIDYCTWWPVPKVNWSCPF